MTDYLKDRFTVGMPRTQDERLKYKSGWDRIWGKDAEPDEGDE